MSTKQDFFSIVIPNWNGQTFLKVCFDSIYNQSYKNFEVVLVDNGSKDDSIAFTEKNYPEVRIIKLPKNLGFSPAVNIGIKESRGELIFLLNNDTELEKDCLINMKKAIDENPGVGFFASKMLDFKDHTIIDTVGDCMTWCGRSYKLGMLEKDSEKYSKPYLIFGACGGAVVYRKKMLDVIGLLDEDFFAYLEDVDLDFRAQLAGHKCLFVPDAKVFHIGSATSSKISGFAFKLMIKNHWHLIFKNYPCQRIVTNLPKIIYSDLRFLAAAIRYSMVKDYFWGLYHSLLEFPKMVPKRIKIQKNRKVTLKYLDTIIDQDFKYKTLGEIINGRK